VRVSAFRTGLVVSAKRALSVFSADPAHHRDSISLDRLANPAR
jgi:hypothetical protein